MADKERSENMVALGVDSQGNVLIKGEDFHWLMEQEERIEELELEKDGWKYTAQSYYMKIQELREQNKRYKQALEEIIRQHELEDEIDDYDFMWNVKQIARKALEGDSE